MKITAFSAITRLRHYQNLILSSLQPKELSDARKRLYDPPPNLDLD
jgi:hypothetical protein